MNTWGGSRAVAVAAAGVLTVALAACNDGSSGAVTSPPSGSGSSGSSTTSSESPQSSKSPEPSASATSSSTAPTGTASSTLNAADIQAKIVAGTPPKDLTWRYPAPPTSWQKLKTDDGTLQWKVRGKCVVTLSQPAGIGTNKTPTSGQVLEHTAEQTSSAFPGTKPKYHDRTTRMVPNVIDGFNGTAKVQMEESLVDYGKIRSRIVAYRKGDYALTAQSVCGDANLFKTASKTELDPFIDKLQAHTKY